MKDWQNVLVSPDTSIRETLLIIDKGALRIALVVDGDRRLLGTVSDGDVRRGLLAGSSLEDKVQNVMYTTPTVVCQSSGREKILDLMRQKQVYQIPVIDDAGVLVGMEEIVSVLAPRWRDNWVILMAGGLGTRLKPLTDKTPKPLLKIGGKPILETILDNFKEYGFNKFFISVNYKSELIEQYFGDGSRWGVKIDYLREDKKLGTAGALSLLPEKTTSPVVVMNSDVLTKVNFQQLLDFHQEHKAVATMCVSEYDFQVPYGVVKLDRHRIASIEEKPIQRFFVNAGIYVLGPDVLDMVPSDEYYDMTTLFEKIIDNKMDTAAFPVREYWLDIGRMDDFEQATVEYKKVFPI